MEADGAVTQADAVAARELRDAFCTVFRAHAGCAEAMLLLPDAEVYLQRVADRYPLVLKITAEGCRLVPSQAGILGAFAGLLAAASDLSSHGDWLRMKLCKNHTCHEAFFDKTRNSSGLYCSAACSSQASQRAYRTRLKGAGACAAS
jgi:predicted RNA-binding Zn ribbon-like protein